MAKLQIRELRYVQQLHTWEELWERLKNGKITFEPIYNKKFGKEWSIPQKSKFIESIFLGLPLPPFYFDGADWNNWLVVDGRKRLKAFYEFMNNEFALEKLDFLELNNKKEYIGFRYIRRLGNPDEAINCYISTSNTEQYREAFFKRFSTYSGTQIKKILNLKQDDKQSTLTKF